ncbi:hypothetical protein Tco_0815887 [Tanacetum coccineum]
MMRHLDASKKFVMYPRFLQIFLRNQLRDVPVLMDHFPVPALTKKVLTFMVKKGKNFSGNVIPLFNSMLVQPTEDEGKVLERPYESHPIPSPTHLSEDQPESQPDPSPRPSSSIPIPDSNPEGSGGNHGAWFRAARLKKQQKNKDMEKLIKRRNVIQIGRKAVNLQKGAPSVQTHTDWDGLDTDLEATLNEAMDYTLAQDKGKTDSKGGSTKSTDLQQSTVKPDESTVKPDESTVKQDEGTDRQVEGTAENKDQDSKESATIIAPTTTLTPTSMVFGDDETIAQVLVTMKDESDTESEDITEAEKKFKMLANDEEMAEKVQEEWEAEEKKEMLVEEEAAKIAFTNEYDFIQPRLNADKILAEKVQEEERENFTIEERAKLLHDTIAAQRRFLA